ncbi:hypothetical protein K1719_005744 [Acacia pycnantha]|nr:hypothetical protein K1719_005744 [Acacia pycnantha]
MGLNQRPSAHHMYKQCKVVKGPNWTSGVLFEQYTKVAQILSSCGNGHETKKRHQINPKLLVVLSVRCPEGIRIEKNLFCILKQNKLAEMKLLPLQRFLQALIADSEVSEVIYSSACAEETSGCLFDVIVVSSFLMLPSKSNIPTTSFSSAGYFSSKEEPEQC